MYKIGVIEKIHDKGLELLDKKNKSSSLKSLKIFQKKI